MANPPDNVEAAELWRKLSEVPRPSEVVDFPRKVNGRSIAKIRVQILNMVEHDNARLKALEAMRTKLGQHRLTLQEISGNIPLREVYDDACARELLSQAVRTVNPICGTEDLPVPTYGMMFRDAEHLNQELTGDEIGTLFAAYEMVQAKWGPYEGNIRSEDELTAWIHRLAEAGEGPFFLTRLPLPALLMLTASLAQRAYSLSAVLASLSSSLPDTTRSALAASRMGIDSSSWPRVEFAEDGLTLDPAFAVDPASTAELDDDGTADSLVTIEDAAELARTLFHRDV